jgi:hypothetical protein
VVPCGDGLTLDCGNFSSCLIRLEKIINSPKTYAVKGAVKFKVRKANEHEGAMETTPWQRVVEYDAIDDEWKAHKNEYNEKNPENPIVDGTANGKQQRLAFVLARYPNYVDGKTQLEAIIDRVYIWGPRYGL